MQTKYEKKVIEPFVTKKKAPPKDGEIYKDGSVWKFKWKGSECGYATEEAAKEGLDKVSGASKEKD
jgi:hypothetical protein